MVQAQEFSQAQPRIPGSAHSRVHCEASGARAWPRAGVLALGAALRGPGVAPDGLGAPGMVQAQEFSQVQPRIPGSTH